jgi:hypothetical protein
MARFREEQFSTVGGKHLAVNRYFLIKRNQIYFAFGEFGGKHFQKFRSTRAKKQHKSTKNILSALNWR